MGALREKIRTVFSFPVALASLLVLWVFMLSKGNLGDPDIWWHLLNARYLLDHHQLPRFDMYSSTALGQPWINHEWLAEIPYFLAWRFWGLAGINALAILLVAVIFLGIFYLSYKSSRNLKASWIVTCLAVLLARISFGPRPVLFGYLDLIVLLAILERYRSCGRGPLWLIPPLFCLWINTHGSWLLGMIVLGIVIASGLTERTWEYVEAVRWSPRQLRNLLVTAGVSVAVLFINPFGYRLVFYPFDLAFRQKLNVAYGEEWASVDFHSPRGRVVLAAFVVLLLGALLGRYRWKLEELALAAFAFYSGLMHVRFLFLIAILATPLVAKFLDFVPPYRPEIDKPLLNAALIAAVVAIMVGWFPSRAQLETEVAKTFPAQALGFMKSHRLAADGFNYYGWGGYLEWKNPGLKTFIDGRTDIFEYTGVLQDYLDAAAVADPLKVLDKRGIQWVVFPPEEPLAYFLAHTENWKVVYNDSVAEVFERASPAPRSSPNAAVAEARRDP